MIRSKYGDRYEHNDPIEIIPYEKGMGPFNCEVHELEEIASKYGRNTSIGEVIDRVKGNNTFTCPKCEGRGYIKVKFNAYPTGFPDSGWVDDYKAKDIECDLCNGFGYTSTKYKPKMVQDGWETE